MTAKLETLSGETSETLKQVRTTLADGGKRVDELSGLSMRPALSEIPASHRKHQQHKGLWLGYEHARNEV